MPQLKVIAKAVRLAVRAKAETLYTQATQETIVHRPLVMRPLWGMRLTVEATTSAIITRAKQVALLMEAKSERLIVRAETNFVPYEPTLSPQVGMAMVGDVMLG